jgi:altronate dehydratase
MRDVILLHPADSICVAARDLLTGTRVDLADRRLQLLDDVAQGHKIARTEIQSGETILKSGIVAGGANVMAFATGRGSCLGFKPTPVLKIASNTSMYERMRDEMDVNAGTILSEGRSVEDVGEEILARILAIARGEQPKSERLGLGGEEFQPWILGPVL